MKPCLDEDLMHLQKLAFHRLEYSQDDFRRFYAVAEKSNAKVVTQIEVLRRWMLVPITLWPMNIHDIFVAALDRFEAAKELDDDMKALLQTLPEPPSEDICNIISKHEHLVERGHYEDLVNCAEKFAEIESDIANDPAFQCQWKKISSRWDLPRRIRNSGILRRSLANERNLRPDFHVDWQQKEDRFQAVFDAFCLKWNLYGMQGDQPLVMKLSVNPTAHGTIIFIPAFWSFDAKRDVKWAAVMKLHRSRSRKKQGKKLAANRESRRNDAKILHRAELQAKTLGLRGIKKRLFIYERLGWVEDTDPKRLRDLLAEFPIRINAPVDVGPLGQML